MKPISLVKGRGAQSNRDGRYNATTHETEHDDWEYFDNDSTTRTEIASEIARTIIAHNQSPDVPFEQSINPYRGCEHGCIYCFARPTHAYLGLSPGLDFETKLSKKTNAAALLRKELQKPRYRCSPIALGANTDPYQPIERHSLITRQILQVLSEFNHPCTITTKSALVERDTDILQEMAKKHLVQVNLSITTLDPELARSLEPRASTPLRRLRAIERLRESAIPVNVMVAPVIPVLTDPELESILEEAATAGAESAGYILIRLPLEVAEMFEEWLQAHSPGQTKHVLNQIRDCRGGRANDPRFGHRLRGQGVYADMIAQRFKIASRRLGLDRPTERLDCSQFRGQPQQLDLF
ncbi:PA0069 family radical SAM protein [Methylomarinum vadi]|uniref:PA0069 family radical SAM protein n=1 Tax=Methylomarinum vadi TaxID=438855 RepID=UPI0004DF633B|nr:PA0069 family radical SAM protein [Methylomarinum vadi]